MGGPPRTDGVVGPGMTVTIQFVEDEEEVTFLLASREESGSPIDVYSPRLPLGAAIMGQKVGEKGHLLPAQRPLRHRRDPGRRALRRRVRDFFTERAVASAHRPFVVSR